MLPIPISGPRYYDLKLDPVRIVMAAPRELLVDGKLPTDRHLVVATECAPPGMGRNVRNTIRVAGLTGLQSAWWVVLHV